MDESKFVIGCVSCNEKNCHVGHNKFPAETGFIKSQLTDFFAGYTCPFCGSSYVPTASMMKMISRFLDGFSHVRTTRKGIEVYGRDVKISFPAVPENAVPQNLDSELYQQFKNFLFQNSDEDLPILLEAMQDIDLDKWYIRIESANNPEPLLRDDVLWTDILTGDVINKED
ncbi:hypothetical protein L1765_10150 [Microaerobacter geothermalis]|uniref:hypothetical protein n=1 Tax=Microaerobacter geothermalis TaxID=674972 RepID=UPI001F3859C8|nr:hypothetical protein [Microaerobacter geothermalis]MCF6094324.1 hypothetical protein [Microaerobacter geothermalis]